MKRFGLIGLLLLGVLAGRASADPITVAWDANPVSDHVIGYVVYIGSAIGYYWQAVDVGNDLSYTFPDAIAGQAYYFAVVAYRQGPEGPEFSPLSGEAHGWSNAPPFLTNPGDRSDVIGTAITPLQLHASDPLGEPVSYGEDGLPTGLTLQGSTGLITGTVTEIGVYTVDITAFDPSVPPLTDTKTFTWTITPPRPTVSLTPDPATVGTALTASVTNGPENARDWAAWFLEGADDHTFLDWCYLNGTKTPPATGIASASVSCFTPTGSGRYQVRLFSNNSYTREATSNTITVPGPAITLTPNPAFIGTALTTAVTAPGSRTDWIGIFAEGATDKTFVDWCYLNGTKTAPLTPITSTSISCFTPTTPGRFQTRLFANNSYTKVATSNTITMLPYPSLSIGGVTAAEGQSGTTNFVFTVNLVPANVVPVTVDYATRDRTAIAGSDYTATAGTLTFDPGVTSQTVTVAVNGDTVFEPSEMFAVELSNQSALNTTISVAEGIGTIMNDDAAPGPTVTMNTPTVNPGGTIDFTVANGPANVTDWVGLYLMGALDMPAPSTWSYLNGLKTPPGTGVSGATLQFAAPATPGTYEVRLFAHNTYTKLATSGPVTVQTSPTLTINDVSVTEGNSGTTTATFTVTLSPVNALQVTVNYATADGTATIADSDYVAASGTLTFGPLLATQTISVTVNGDSTPESTETFLVNLSGAANAVIGDSQGVGTITDDDSAQLGPRVVLTPDPGAVGSPLTANVTMAPGNTTDWVGLFSEGAGDTSYAGWCYLDGNKTPPGAALINPVVLCFTPTVPGRYQVRLFANNGFTKLATSNTITVPGPSIALSPDPASAGMTLTAAVTNGPGNATDWIGLYREGAGDTAFVDWCYLDGTKTKPSSGTANASVTCFTPTSSGRYQVRLFSNNTFTKVITSNTITVP